MAAQYNLPYLRRSSSPLSHVGAASLIARTFSRSTSETQGATYLVTNFTYTSVKCRFHFEVFITAVNWKKNCYNLDIIRGPQDFYFVVITETLLWLCSKSVEYFFECWYNVATTNPPETTETTRIRIVWNIQPQTTPLEYPELFPRAQWPAEPLFLTAKLSPAPHLLDLRWPRIVFTGQCHGD